MTYDELAATGLLKIRAPRYTSYPPATIFVPAQNGSLFQSQLAGLDPTSPVSVYIHIPFCERLCWFCACRTQGVRSLTPVAAYVETLIAELDIASQNLPDGIKMGQLHFGGGTPTILSPALIDKVMAKVNDIFTRSESFRFSVEIDPTLVNKEKIAAFARHGMTRASIGVQDFDVQVQGAIGREQSFETTKTCVEQLRSAGIASLNVDLVYGLPHQTNATFEKTLNDTLELSPDRLSLFGYAHVPHMAKRQRLIPEEALPDDAARFSLFQQASDHFKGRGYTALGIDHFARPSDSLVIAARSGNLRRNFQGYTDDSSDALIGFGASSISRINGYFQNEPRTADYAKRIANRQLPVARQHLWTDEDRLRGRIIEMLLCNYRISLPALKKEFRKLGKVPVSLLACSAKFGDLVILAGDGLSIAPGAEPIVRAVAQFFDEYAETKAIYSRVT